MTRKNPELVAEAVRGLCRALKMPGVLRSLDELVRDADANGAGALDVLEAALSNEVASREASAVRLRIQEAHFPRALALEDFDFTTDCGLEKNRIQQLAGGAFVKDKKNIVLVGPVGTGKTHVATALGLDAARCRHRVSWFRAADLVRILVEAKSARELGRLERRLNRSAVLVLDELGFVPFDREGGELLFNLLSARHGVASTIITSNLAFSEWPKVFGGDDKLTAALLDRLAENAVVFTTKGTSYRGRKRRER